jgi:EAL domain-containing protein (putative c-di-GMP-specific phosphodiesterase class I)
MRAFKQLIFELESKGFLIAINGSDKGSVSASFLPMLELDPTFVKLDRYFSQNLHSNVWKQHFIQSFLRYSEELHFKMILEGIEDEKDLAFAKFLGVSFGQGHIFGCPREMRADWPHTFLRGCPHK